MKCNPSGKCCWAGKLAWLLLIIGGLNWGLVGIGGFAGGDWNVVHMILGSWAWLEWVVYILVGLSALVGLFGCRCSKCKGSSEGSNTNA
ncbi:MAG: hypothetical protein COV07_04430 [Candidatus Vogelbacteria bacterium CG10_big_fil_rev_8_21_14_0_10_45_14]|uniref:DUF378 domain-containing protein n=1 Tax=Candidatus Vogelbacteria bacterium CG10_big_fil_rev_8_21_14_0_10_45_14 TaxID=1975042 RepID=A0A2H0RIJ3_9BACT|nr:MAG: hypothetical protein COV07_04430 [Candidatus Vogelbacteria bacterium CG10_big_fil_rev_8_21_14_0_10_45_14]